MTEEEIELKAALRKKLIQTMPEDLHPNIDVVVGILWLAMEEADELFSQELKGFAKMFRKQAMEHPLNRTSPGLVAAAMTLEAAAEEK